MFANRKHSTFIELDLNEERLYRLPPMSTGTLIVRVFRAAEVRFGPQGETQHIPETAAEDLELELRHPEDFKQSFPGGLIVIESGKTVSWRLWIRRKNISPLNPEAEAPRRYRIEAEYTSQLPILERRIPASFFQDGFEQNYNEQQYVFINSGGPKIFIHFNSDLSLLHGLQGLSIDMSPATVTDIRSTAIRLGTGAGPFSPIPGNSFFISIRADFAAGGNITGLGFSDADFPAFSAILRLYLVAGTDSLRYEPILEADVFFEELDDINGVDGDEEKEKLTAKVRDLQFSQVDNSVRQFLNQFLKPWLVGGNRELHSLEYAPGPGDTPDANGISEPATGDLIVRYVGPRPKPEIVENIGHGPVLPVPDDESIRLFDLPDEDPDSVPGEGQGVELQPQPSIGALAKIDHIVILMQENRSFDQVLGYLSRDGINPEVEGLFPENDPRSKQHLNRFNNRNFFPRKADKEDPKRNRATAWPSLITPGPGHDHNDVATQMSDNMGHFVENFSKRVGDDSPFLRLVMDYFGPDDLPVYATLAREFGICDHWYTAHAGPTWPNRFVLYTGDLSKDPDGTIEFDNPKIKTMLPLQQLTMFDYLNERGFGDWRVFEHGYSFLRLFSNFTYNVTNIVPFNDPERGFEATARKGLPSVTFIEPDYIDLPPGNDDHPPADMADGQNLVNRIMQALINSPSWERTLFIITYDEHGGFYDHADPPDDAPPLLGGLKKLGPRVPAFVISPLIPRGAVFHSRFDHTSVGATIVRRFTGEAPFAPRPDFSPRLNAARDLREVLTLDEARPPSDFPDLFNGEPLARSATLDRSARIGTPDPDAQKEDFHWFLSAMRLVTGQPPTVIKTDIPLDGRWVDRNRRSAVITTTSKTLRINMSTFHRPTAFGSIIDASTIKVTFLDDKTDTGKLELPDKIRWSDNSVWTKT